MLLSCTLLGDSYPPEIPEASLYLAPEFFRLAKDSLVSLRRDNLEILSSWCEIPETSSNPFLWPELADLSLNYEACLTPLPIFDLELSLGLLDDGYYWRCAGANSFGSY